MSKDIEQVDKDIFKNAIESIYKNYKRSQQDLKTMFKRQLQDMEGELRDRGVETRYTSIQDRINEIWSNEEL